MSDILIRLPRWTAYERERTRQRGLVAEAQVSKAMLCTALDALCRDYRDLIEAASNSVGGLPSRTRLFLDEHLRGLHDELSTLDHELNAVIDEGGEDAEKIDMAELDELLGKVA